MNAEKYTVLVIDGDSLFAMYKAEMTRQGRQWYDDDSEKDKEAQGEPDEEVV